MIASVAEGLRPVYGLEGSLLYSAQAEAVFAEYLSGNARRYWGAMHGNELRAVLFTQIVEGRGEITLAHRLDNTLPLPLEYDLFRMAIQDLKARGVEGILAEFLPTSPLGAWDVFLQEGFQRVHRHVLEAPLSRTGHAEPRTRPLWPSDECNAAACLVEAYREDPGRLLHREVEQMEIAQRFVGKVLRGGYGAVTPGMNLCFIEEGRMIGVVLGCLLAPGIGFTLQVATLPVFRGHGIGKALLLAQHQAFAAAGCNRASLAVTAGNAAAESLYAQLGYSVTVEFDTHVWQRRELA
ncbi:MAG: Acetyltransferase family [Candidatus Hydrogenedentota bacterium]